MSKFGTNQNKGKWERRIRRLFNGQPGVKLTTDKLASMLRVGRRDRAAFLLAVRQLEQNGQLRRDTRGRLSTVAKTKQPAKTGTVRILHPRFGFVTLDEGGDCFIPGRYLGQALPGDRVEVSDIEDSERGPQGRISTLLEPGRRLYTGHLYQEYQLFYVKASDGFRYDLPIHVTDEYRAGDMVQFSVVPGRDGWLAIAEQRYGDSDSARVCADAIIDQYGLPTEFSNETLALAEQRAALPVTDKEMSWRTDLRDVVMFTIDGEDAKDLDDGVSLSRLEDGWELGVHIADVSYYVTAGSAIDREALARTTSVYFADRVIPMLPVTLSNGACSLDADSDKRALSAIIRLDKHGHIIDCRLCKSLVRSCLRGVYSEVNSLLDGTATDEIREKYTPVKETLADMITLLSILENTAHKRGVFGLGGVESRFVLDENGVAVDLQPRQSGPAQRLIEQFMITANRAVAALAKQNRLPFVYRVHESPNEERLGKLFDLTRMKSLPTPLSTAEVTPKALQVLTEAAAATPYNRLVCDQLLRSMAKARYDTRPIGHYGLVLEDYCHFTSPIRRYPDLLIHRLLSRWLAGETSGQLHAKLDTVIADAAKATSLGEIRALNAERACEACYRAEYMHPFIGEVFEGAVVSVTENGLFVELPNTVCGMVPAEALPEEVLYFDDFLSLTDREGKPVYTVGQQLRVQVVACHVAAGQVKFVLEK